MSFPRRSVLTNERYNRLLRIADLDATNFNYERDIEMEYGNFINADVKEDFLTSVSQLANLRILTDDIRNRKGIIYGATFTVAVGTPRRIDFLEPSNNVNVPASTAISPRMALYGLHITNKGTGDLLYSINTIGDFGSVLHIANSPTISFTARRPTFEVLNLSATGDSANVNIGIEL